MNPYEVLGVSENADEETIKRAYRELVKKYHPDKYVNNPLADLASEKLKQINEAYDMITSGRASSSNSGSSQSGGYTGREYHSRNSAPSFQEVRILIQHRQFSAAETMLNQLPRNAEWYYLSGILHLNRGWYDQARRDILQAIQMDPNNAEYRATLNSMNSASTGYRSYTGSSYNSSSGALCCPGMDACSCCSNLICADCCCECMGGDLISCC